MFSWVRRGQASRQLVEHERAEHEAHSRVAALFNELVDLFRDLSSEAGPRVVAGIGPKGGSGKTTALVAASYLLSQVVTGDLILVDVNPDKSSVRERLVRAGQRGTLLELIAALGTLHYPTQLARFQVPINRVKLIHKDGLRSADVQQVSSAKWYELLETLSWYGQLVLADGGLSLVSPAATGSLARADHVVLAVEADPVVIQKTLEAVNEVMADDPAVHDLLLGATVVVAYTNPSADLDPLLQESIDYLRRVFAGVFLVPYDPAAAVSGLIPFDRLTLPAQEAYLRIALHLAECFHRPPRATHAPGAVVDSTSAPDVDGDRGSVHGATSSSDGSPMRYEVDAEDGAGGAGVPTAFAIGGGAGAGSAGSNGGRSG